MPMEDKKKEPMIDVGEEEGADGARQAGSPGLDSKRLPDNARLHCCGSVTLKR